MTASFNDLFEQKQAKWEEKVTKNVTENVLGEVGETLSSYDDQFRYAKKKYAKIDCEISGLRKVIIQQQRDLLNVKLDSKKCNIFICGVKDDRFEKRDATEKTVRELLAKVSPNLKDCCLQECKRVGQYSKEHPRNIFVKFLKQPEKETFMRGKGTLNVICKNDYPKEINQLHRMLSPAIEAVKGTVYDYPVTKVVLGKLVINNVV